MSEARQESIFNTNQAQNAEAVLNTKIEELVANYQQMKALAQEREEASQKTLQESTWKITRLEEELASASDARDHLA